MRDAVSTCTTASTIAPVASHAFAAIVEREDELDDVGVRRVDVAEHHGIERSALPGS